MWGISLIALFFGLGFVGVYGLCVLNAVFAGTCNVIDTFLGHEGHRPDPVNIGFTLLGIASGAFLRWRFINEADGY